MRIEVRGGQAISGQACTYAEYRLFAALSQAVDTNRVMRARLALQRIASDDGDGPVSCTATIELEGRKTVRFQAFASHPYAAINEVADRVNQRWGPQAAGDTPRPDPAVPQY